MDEPVDYREVARHLRETRGLPSVDVPTGFHGTWLDNSKAKFLLGWRPHYDLRRLDRRSVGLSPRRRRPAQDLVSRMSGYTTHTTTEGKT